MRNRVQNQGDYRQIRYGRPARVRVPQRGAVSSVVQPTLTPNPPTLAPEAKPVHKKTPISSTKTTLTAAKSPVDGMVIRPKHKPQSPASEAHRAPAKTGQHRNDKLQKKLVRTAKILRALELQTTDKKPQRRTLAKLWKFRRPKLTIRQLAVRAAAMVLVGVSLYATIDTYLLNSRIKENMDQSVSAQQSDDPNTRQAAEGKDEKQVSSDIINGYKVAADLPRTITIDKLNARGRVLQMGVNNDGSMQAPINIFDAGWYTGSVKPGQLGATVIIAHASGPTQGGLFEGLNKLTAGEIVKVELGSGQVLKYQVVSTETVALEQVDMDKFMRPAEGIQEGLNLMTCAGSWVRESNTRAQRTIVYTKRLAD